MAYTIPYTDEANNGTIVVVDNTIDQTTTLKLPKPFIGDAMTSIYLMRSSPRYYYFLWLF